MSDTRKKINVSRIISSNSSDNSSDNSSKRIVVGPDGIFGEPRREFFRVGSEEFLRKNLKGLEGLNNTDSTLIGKVMEGNREGNGMDL